MMLILRLRGRLMGLGGIVDNGRGAGKWIGVSVAGEGS